MADGVDVASAYHGEEVERRISAIREAAKVRPYQPNGECHFCFAPVEGARVFCNSECAVNDERLKANRRY